MPTPVKRAFALLREAASDWMSDNAPRLGASLAYYTVFSVSPLMIIVLAIAGFWFGQAAAREQIFHEISGLVGNEGARAIEGLLAHAQQPERGAWATGIAGVTLLVGSTGVFVELQDALNTVWGVKPRSSSTWWSFIWNRVLSFAMVLAIGFLLLVSLILSAGLAAVGKYIGGFAPEIRFIWEWVNFVVSFSVVTLLFALIFKILPDVKIAWRDVWIGAVITSFLFTLGKFLLGLYLGRTSIASSYGAAGSIVVLLVWVYYSAQILFFGAEFTQVYANQYGKRLAPDSYAEPIHVEDTIPAALKRRGEIPTGADQAHKPTPAPEPRAESAPERRDWGLAIPVAALMAWTWLKERRRSRRRS